MTEEEAVPEAVAKAVRKKYRNEALEEAAKIAEGVQEHAIKNGLPWRGGYQIATAIRQVRER